MILVAGSTGFVGQRVVRRLAGQGRRVRALVRPGADAGKVDAIRAEGVTFVEGDLKDPPSLRVACDGVSTVISTASATISRGAGDTIDTVDRDGQLALVDAARDAKVRHFIYLSFSGNMDVPSPLHDAKRAVERRVKEGRMTYTIVRPSIFMEVWLSPHAGFDPVGGSVRIFGTGDAPISVISAADVAEYVAACVENPMVHNQTIELGGPRAVSLNDVVDMFERALGRSVQRNYVPAAALEQQVATAAEPLQKTLAALALGVSRGDAIDSGPALVKARITLTPVSDYVKRVAGLQV
ncbi:MAG: SDR family oxidoreductase [Acidobacteria bacterium]|nr:SDR family oxidoreductase [Acidobacteriota bacterium]